MRSNWKIAIALIYTAGILSAVTGCGSADDNAGSTGPGDSTTAKTVLSPSTNSAAGATGVDSGPVMPNVDETQVEAVSTAAITAFEREWGDGSDVNVVWGPNIISGWALIGLENNSGAAGKDVLLALENGTWLVKDMGNDLAARWDGQTPAAMWPSM